QWRIGPRLASGGGGPPRVGRTRAVALLLHRAGQGVRRRPDPGPTRKDIRRQPAATRRADFPQERVQALKSAAWRSRPDRLLTRHRLRPRARLRSDLRGLCRRAARRIRAVPHPRERIWIAEQGSRLIGCVAIVAADPQTAQLRLYLVDPAAR